jgi:hypothetical protein
MPRKIPASAPLTFSGRKHFCLGLYIDIDALHSALVTYQRGSPVYQDLRSFPYLPDVTPDNNTFPSFLSSCIKKAGGTGKEAQDFPEYTPPCPR